MVDQCQPGIVQRGHLASKSGCGGCVDWVSKDAPVNTPCDGGVVVRIYRPSLDLQSIVTFFYFVEASAPLTDFPCPEWGNVRFAISGHCHVARPGFDNPAPEIAVIYGPSDRHGKITTSGGKTIVFGLTPIGWHRLIGGNAGTMANRVEPLGRRLGIEGETLRAQLIGDDDDAASVARLEALILGLLARRRIGRCACARRRSRIMPWRPGCRSAHCTGSVSTASASRTSGGCACSAFSIR